ERADDPVWPYGTAVGQSEPAAIHPHAGEPEPLRRSYVEFEVVANHQRLARTGVERLERLPVDRLVRFSRPELSLDHDLVEEAREIVALDLVALLARVAVRHERQRDAAPA